MLEKLGLVKLGEECAELNQELASAILVRALAKLQQISAKKMTRMDSDLHWDGQGSLKERLENEMGDVIAFYQIALSAFAI